MENKEISTESSDFDSICKLRKIIECLENELTKVSAKVLSLEKLLLVAESVLSRCSCAELKDQILSLLSSLHGFTHKTAADSPNVLRVDRVDVATQCDGKYMHTYIRIFQSGLCKNLKDH